jgi:tRNA pseudouridine13 synthase
MKLKQIPEDFHVEELTDVAPGRDGEFALYRLEKVNWTTPDALQIVSRQWNVPWKLLGYGGLKDRHAETVQFVSIYRGPRRNLDQERMRLLYLGQVRQPFGSQDIRANRFRIVIRSLTVAEVPTFQKAIADVSRAGVPNYFDDQRFGSVGADGRFIGRELVFGRYEEGLKMALAAPYEFDRADAKEEKRILIDHWNDWLTCKAKLPRGHARSLVDYLVHHPTDFKGAIERLRPELQGIYLSAYQSELWNRVLAKWLRNAIPQEMLGEVVMQRGPLPAPNALPPEITERWEKLWLPLACPRYRPEPNDEGLPQLEEVLAEEGLTLKKLKLPGLNRPYFSKGERRGCLKPEEMASTEAVDELNGGKRKLILNFDLPRGSYATMVVKRIAG